MNSQPATTTTTTEPIAVSIRTAAGMLDLPQNIIRQAVYVGHLRTLRLGSRLLVEVTELKRWIRSDEACSALLRHYGR